MTDLPDTGVAAKGGFVCQNFDEHDDEITMRSGPFNGVQCPECGRMAGGPDMDIPYYDPPDDHGGTIGIMDIVASWDDHDPEAILIVTKDGGHVGITSRGSVEDRVKMIASAIDSLAGMTGVPPQRIGYDVTQLALKYSDDPTVLQWEAKDD